MELTPQQQAEWDAVIQAEIDCAPTLSASQVARLSALFDYGQPTKNAA